MKAKGLKVGWQPEALLYMALGLLPFAGVVPACGQAGSLDASYQPNPSYVVASVAIQPDGKALIGGGFGTVDGLDRRYLARLNTNGTVDVGFVPATIEGAEVRGLALQPDGKILVGGQFSRVGGSSAFQVARLQTNGTLDMTFNSALSSSAYFRALALQTDGKVLVASDDGLDRLMPDGSRDTNFLRFSAFQWITNGGGMTSANNSIRAIAELGDGRILLGGDIQAIAGLALGAGLIRLNADGTWDQSFHTLTNWAASALLVQPDGQIVVGRNGRLARLNPDGTMDNTFAPQTIEGDVMALARQPDGKILVGGYYQRAAGLLRPGVARFNADGTLDRNFDAGDVNGFTVKSVALQADKEILIGGYFTSVSGQSRSYVARLHNDNTNYPGRFEFLSVSNSVAEAMGNMVIPVSRYAGSAGTATVVVATDWGSALPDVDYLSRTQTLVFLPGQTSNYFTVPILDDLLVEGPYGWETFDVRLSAPTGGATLGSETRAIGYILEDDTAIGFANSAVAAYEAAGQAAITVVRFGVTNSPVSVFFQTESGTAVVPSDYTAQSGTIAFASGETSKSILVPLVDDELVEGEETFTIALSAATGGASLGLSNTLVHITDDVSILEFSSYSFAGTETDGGATVTVQRRGRTNNAVSVHYATSNLTALAGSDYVATSGTINLVSGQVETSFTVPIVNDALVEGVEMFNVIMSQPMGAAILSYGSAAMVSIISEDGAGFPDTTFKPPAANSVRHLALYPDGKLLVLHDYTVISNSVRTPLVRYLADGSVDPTFQADLPDQVYGFVVGSDGKVFVSTGVGLGTHVERLLGNGSRDAAFQPFYLDYLLWFSSGENMVVQADGRLIISDRPSSYYAPTTNQLNRLNLDGTWDSTYVPPKLLAGESFYSGPGALALQPDGKLLIAGVFVSSNGVSRLRLARLTEDGQWDTELKYHAEFDRGVAGIRLLADGNIVVFGGFSSVNAISRPFIARLASDGSLDSNFVPALAAPSSAYDLVSSLVVQSDGKLIFSGNVRLSDVFSSTTTARLRTDGSLDGAFHPQAALFSRMVLQGDGKLVMGGPSSVYPDPGFLRVNNDPGIGAGYVQFATAVHTVPEGNQHITLTLRRVGGSNGLVVVRYATSDDLATGGADYLPQAGVLEYAPGETSDKLITIPLLDDTLVEGDESFVISLGTPMGGAVWGEHAATSVTIRENDMAVQFLSARFRARENVGSSLISVQRLGRLTGTASVDYTTSDGTAQAGLDYLSQSGTLTFTDGETNKLIVVPIRDDLLSESDETVELALSHPTNGAMLGTNATAELVIVDNDRPGTLDGSFNSGTGVCGDPGWGEVYAVAVKADGRILVGGSFSRFNDVPCRGLVRLLPNGSVDPGFAVGLPIGGQLPLVTRLAPQPDGKVLLVAALGSLYNDNFLARVNLDGSFDNSFGFALAQGTGGGGPGRIEALLLQPDGRILIGGRFDTAKGVARTNLARFNPDGSLDAALATQVTMSFGPGQITALSSDGDGKLLIGGLFDKVNGVGRHNLARLGPTGVLDPTFDPPGLTNAYSDNSGVWLQTIAVQSNGKVLVGGTLSQFIGQKLPILARLNTTGSLDTNFSAVVSNGVFDATPYPPDVSVVLCQPDNKLLVGGHFMSVNGVFRKNLARLNPDGSLDLSFQSGEEEPSPYYYWAEEEVRALAVQPDGQIIVGGKFSEMDGQSRCAVARLNGVKLSLGGVARDADGQWRIRFTGTADAHYSVLASSNLIHWEIIGAAVETATGSFEFSDPGAANQPCRFYRLRSP